MTDHARRSRWPAFALATMVCACAIAPLQPDLQARAPRLEGFGAIDVRVTTRSVEAQRLFNQGMLQAYAFNEAEAVRQFKAALAADPACAMCAWGVAWQLGPNINAPQRGDLTQHRQYIVHALKNAAAGTPRERALIDAMAVRYGESPRDTAAANGPGAGDVCRGAASSGGTANPLDLAYAERLHALLLAHPDDADILSLWSEAAMLVTDDWYDDASGKPAPRIAEMVERLERALAKQPNHTGLNHYLIHAADAAVNAPRAVAAADRLGALAPNSPHLVHMPAHIFVRVGRYADAAQVNERAVAADVTLAQMQRDQGFTVSKDWRGHNTHFLWYASLMQGRGDAALGAARTMAERAAKREDVYAEYARSLPLLTLLRLEHWEALRAEPVARGEQGLATVLGEHAHSVALARSARLADARAALQRAEAGAETLRRKHGSDSDDDKGLRDFAATALARARAEFALAERRGDEALAQQAIAVASARRADDAEPPRLGAGARLALAEMQLSLGRAADAEATFRADLAALPDSGWALHGLARALAAQGKRDEAAVVRQRAERAWAQADAALKART
jgi:tetratricopeptide (TPR) repeat protein